MAKIPLQDPKDKRGAPKLMGLCDHCGLPLKAGSFRAQAAGVEQSFCCYGCFICQRMIGETGSGGASSLALARMSLGGLLGMPLMALSVIDYIGGFSESDSLWEIALVYWIIFGLATGIVLLLGIPYFYNALRSLLLGSINADVLIAIGALTAYGTSAYTFLTTEDMAALAQHHQLYFDSGAMILVLVSLGKFVEAAARKRTTSHLHELSDVDASEAIVLRDAEGAADAIEERIPTDQLRVGQIVRLLPGAVVPADGHVLSGKSEIAEAMLTGEGRPVTKQPGDYVLAGTINGTGSLTLQVTAVGEDATRAKVMELAREALSRRSPTELIVDRVARFFVPMILLVAAGTFAAHAFVFPDPTLSSDDAIFAGLRTALSVLVVACPCALGLATPLAVAIGISRAAQFGMLFRSGEAIETLAGVERIYLDKTGTLTTGDFHVVEATFADQTSEAVQRRAWAACAGLEAQSEHWLARGMLAFARSLDIEPAKAENVRALPGRGVEGSVDGERWWAGSRDMLTSTDELPQSLGQAIERAEERGDAVVLFGHANSPPAVVALADLPKPNAGRAVARLRRMGIEPVMVTGDHAAAAATTAKKLGIARLYADVLPEQKLALIEAERDPSRVAMTGDGVNDGPALMRAGVGISFANATGLAKLAAGLTLLGSDLLKLANAVPLARKTVATIRLNLVWAFIYNIGAIMVATTGYLSPVMAAFAMLFSSIFVVQNSWRLSRYGDAQTPVSLTNAKRLRPRLPQTQAL